MVINTHINILGGLPDFNLVTHFIFRNERGITRIEDHHNYTAIKTDKSVRRFGKAITATFLKFGNNDLESLLRSVLKSEEVSNDSLLLLFWQASSNNDLFHYLNTHVFFPSFYSGRISIGQEEVLACVKDLKATEPELVSWSDATLSITSSKYLTLLKKFNLMVGNLKKTIIHPYLSDKMFVLFVYWLNAVETRPNLFESEWLKYSFFERNTFIERALQKKYAKYFNVVFTGENLRIETTFPYQSIYDACK